MMPLLVAAQTVETTANTIARCVPGDTANSFQARRDDGITKLSKRRAWGRYPDRWIANCPAFHEFCDDTTSTYPKRFLNNGTTFSA
jgi:hypothetical protein